jgi:hypothetical protein
MFFKVYRKLKTKFKHHTIKEAIDNGWITEDKSGLISTDLRTKIAASSGAFDTHGQLLFVGDVVGYKGDTFYVTYNTSNYEFGLICDIGKTYTPLRDVKTDEVCKIGSVLENTHKKTEWIHLLSEGEETGYSEYTFASNYRL